LTSCLPTANLDFFSGGLPLSETGSLLYHNQTDMPMPSGFLVDLSIGLKFISDLDSSSGGLPRPRTGFLISQVFFSGLLLSRPFLRVLPCW